MPWEIRFTDILQALCSSLIEFSQKKNALSDAFIQILSSDTVDHCADILSQNGFGADSVYTVALCNGEDSETVAESISVSTPYTHTFRYNGYSVIVSVAENIILPEGPDLKAHTGISCARGGIDKIPALFKQAKDAMSAASIRGKAYENYKDIGVLALIFDALDKNELKRKALKRLAPILDYDSTHNSELIDTLFHYIRTGGSLAETARLTFTHRNTAGYRMNKLRELCGTDFSDVEERFNYLTMIYIVKAKL
jgi:hypothetical protein